MRAHTRCPSASNAGSSMCFSVQQDKRLQCFRLRHKERACVLRACVRICMCVSFVHLDSRTTPAASIPGS